MDEDLHWLTAAQLSNAYRTHALSPVEVAEYLLGRIEALDASFNCFCLIDEAVTMAAATASEERWREGAPLSPLDGVPFAIKDLLITKGWPTLRGSLTVEKHAAWSEDAPAVARLKEAGAVPLGKTTTPEFGWKGTNDNPLTGTTRNPWNTDVTPGGSSGGSAAALAAGFAPMSLGTDGGGSIRIPASFTNSFGLKPSFGRVPAFPLSPFGTLAHVGPMARTVRDAATMLSIIAKPDARDWYALNPCGIDYERRLEGGIKGWRIAFSLRLGTGAGLHKDIEAGIRGAAKTFEDLGAIVEEVDPALGNSHAVFRTLWWSAAAHFLKGLPPAKRALLDPGLQRMLEEGDAMSKADVLQAALDRGAIGSSFRQYMEGFDVLLCPAVAVPPFATGRLFPGEDKGDAWLHWTPFSYPFNLTQNPAASVPCGFTADGFPFGLQIVGRMFDDASVLRAAYAYEEAKPFHLRHPDGL